LVKAVARSVPLAASAFLTRASHLPAAWASGVESRRVKARESMEFASG
jgi:hypothetical protein